MQGSIDVNGTHRSLRGYGTWGMEFPTSPGRGWAVGQHPGTDIDPVRGHTRDRTSGTVKRWAGGWYRRSCVLAEPGPEAKTHTVCTKSCPGPWNKYDTSAANLSGRWCNCCCACSIRNYFFFPKTDNSLFHNCLTPSWQLFYTLKHIDVARVNVHMQQSKHEKNILCTLFFLRSRASTVSLVARSRTGRAGFGFLVGSIDFSLLQNRGTSSGAHTASYVMGTGVLCWGKAAGVWSWPLTVI